MRLKRRSRALKSCRKQAEARAAEIKRREEAEAERKRIEQETAERLKREEEQRRIDQANARARGAFSNTGNVGTAGQSQGVAGGQGNQGVESGTPDAPNYGPGGGQGTEGISFDLGGRKAQSLFRPPYDIQKDGIVVVAVTVDRSGRVTEATPGIKGSTTLDETLLKLAKEAALKTTFEKSNDAPIIQKGTITYIFKLQINLRQSLCESRSMHFERPLPVLTYLCKCYQNRPATRSSSPVSLSADASIATSRIIRTTLGPQLTATFEPSHPPTP